MQQVALELAERMSLITVSSTMKVAAEADRLRREGADVVDFGAGEPDFPTPQNIKRAAIAAIEGNKTKYTPAGGTTDLRKAICERHAKDFGTQYSLAECSVSVGGKHSIFNIMQALVRPGDEVIIPVPYWVTYFDVVNYAGGKPVFVHTQESEGFVLTAAMLEPHINERTRLVIVNSPSNPSGAVIPREEWERIYRLAKERGVLILTDECYCQFLYESAPFSGASFPDAKETVLVSGSLSKTYAMTGWRIGFTLAPANVTAAIIKLQSHSTSNPTTPAQMAALEAVTGPQDSVAAMLAEYRQRRDYVIGRLRAMPGVTTNVPEGAFYAYPNISCAMGGEIGTTMAFAEKLLAEEQVAVVPGEAFGTEQHVRISYAASMEDLARGLDRLERFIARYRRG